ncbi:gluconokinase [Pseudoclavibacter sp. RFBB5]|uniref:gluconokinase n=1 Tax=Pseudoclavibacter sp. RFBB5 TaxID=2080574 RepID=UPI000CE834CE|nr:gluconokinase, GntK/IdnK-type [Pseudoclavibacter sp. RFBB5]PPG33505.1 gluconate kinase [Pseudoclavibacter sp. RFBB5]
MSDAEPRRIVVFGVSAVGKSTIGAALAAKLSLPFLDADALHSDASLRKMTAGVPLDDFDRRPWLLSCGRALAQSEAGMVLACSALARRYRDLIRLECPDAVFLHLHASYDDVLERAVSRDAHFMPPALLQSQFEALELLGTEEAGAALDARLSVGGVLDAAVKVLDELSRPGC